MNDLQAALHGTLGPSSAASPLATVAFRQARHRIRRGLPPGALRRVREHMEAHLGNSVNIQSLASIACLSPDHFAHAFKQSAGVSPHTYLLQRRVQRTQQLLADTDLPVAQIAAICGFSGPDHCACRFKELIGLTPRQYRWSMR